MKILWHSNAPFAPAGYGTQSALFIPRIAALGHEIIISSPYSFGGCPIEWEGFPVLGICKDPAGNDVLAANYEYTKADLLLTLADVFSFYPSVPDLAKMNVAHWFPVDCAPMGEADVTVLREGGGIPIAMSRFGERVIRAEGADSLYVPHGVDCSVFAPGDKAPYRESADIGADTFTIGVLGMNRHPQRKAFFEQMLAFARFHQRHPDSVLTLHTADISTPGLNLAGMATRLGIARACRWPDTYSYRMGLISRENLALWYQGLDVLSNCAYGEGFGLAAIEAQACGIPVILTNGHTGPELCGTGWLAGVEKNPFWAEGHGAMWPRPDATDIEAAYEQAWTARENGEMPALGEQARAFSLNYDAGHVLAQHWKPALAEIESRIGYAEKVA